MSTDALMNRPRVCLVTGASRGIGLAVARRLVTDGHHVAMAARSRERIEAVAHALADEHTGCTLGVACDLTSSAEIDALFATVERNWAPVEVLVASAGTGWASPLTDTSDEDWQRVLDLNLTSPFRCVRRAMPPMVQAQWGRVVVVASVVAKRGEAQVSAYTASKHGVMGLVRAAAAEYARTGVTVNAVCPGYVDTPMTERTIAAISARTGRSLTEARASLERRQPIGRLIDPTEVAEAVHFCVVNAAVTGQGINVDGGAFQA